MKKKKTVEEMKNKIIFGPELPCNTNLLGFSCDKYEF